MASLSIAALFTFYVNESKSVSRGENHFKSEHVLSCSYFEGLITGKVRASMKNKEYSVRVSAFISRKFQQFKATRTAFKCGSQYVSFSHQVIIMT